MTLLFLALGVLLASGLAAFVRPRFGVIGAVTGSAIGLIPAIRVLLGSPVESLRFAWSIPYATFFVQLDALSAFFLLPVFGLSGLVAVYGNEYLGAWREKKPLGTTWFFFNLLVASMTIVVLARNAMLFLMAWELMALTSFFLVTFEHEKKSVRTAGWTYLVASHLGTAFLLAMFVLLGRDAGSLDFDRFNPINAGGLFLLAVIGFGTKAGFMPLHVWLPEAHPAAPSHVSALMSGVMIKMGIYGLLRTITFLGAPPDWWGWLLVAIGLSSGVLGVLFALAQHDLKRLLAYSSVENIGIIALGIGVGLLGLSHGIIALAVLGFAGALLHVINHAMFKGLLFLGAGAVLHATGTSDLEHLGGLSKRMPWTAATFLIGAVAISGLPPLNGFVSEFLVYLGSYKEAAHGQATTAMPLLATIAGLALIGGLATACFTKAFGIVFLGEPRNKYIERAHDPGWAMRAPMLILAAGCGLVGLLAPRLVGMLMLPVADVTKLAPSAIRDQLADTAGSLWMVTGTGVGLIVLVGFLILLRHRLLANRGVQTSVTWDCGYRRPTARMQYTASSFSQPITDLFAPVLQTRRQLTLPKEMFPGAAALATETDDVAHERLYRPFFTGIDSLLARCRWLQHGNVHLYVLYIALTLLVLLIWKLG